MYIIGLTPTPTPAQSLHELILRLIVYRSFSCRALRSSLTPPRRSRKAGPEAPSCMPYGTPPSRSFPYRKSRIWWGSRKHALAFSQAGKAGATRSDWAADALGKFEKHRTTSEMHLARHPPGREMTESRKSPQLFLVHAHERSLESVDGVGPIIYMSPAHISLHASFAHTHGGRIRRSTAFVANRSCKRQAPCQLPLSHFL